MGQSEITRILEAGQPDAVERVMPLVYNELRALAASQLRHERPDHTLQPTALVHELYVKLAGTDGFDAKNRGHFFAAAATSIRQILVDHARRAKAQKRGSDWQRVTLSTPVTPAGGNDIDVISLHEAMQRLAEIDPRRATIVELRVFGGMTGEEIADHLGLSRTSITKEWRFARAWLSRALAE
ncbi:MAG TPA: ECF-type sigma factor [Phycisphaerae bacterium]|nr:ECF-type sigma factor [Phycisphaerae bacterium]